MSFDLWGVPIFHEDFAPTQTTLFDSELDEIATAYAVEKRAITGFCNLDGTATDFLISSDNLREDVISQASGSINRHRQVVCAISTAIFGLPHASLAQITAHINRGRLRVYTAEANSALFQFLHQHLDPDLFTYSEFFGEDRQPGDRYDGVLHQDLQQTSFADESFDLILTCEVFEHIPDAPRAEREVVRILKPGGVYCFTVPFTPHGEHDLVLADLDPDGRIRHLAEPQYHGDPLRPEEGILVYRIFSFNDLKRRFEALGCRFSTYRFWSKSLGILGDNGWVHVVRKPPGDVRGPASSVIEERGLARLQEELSHTRALLADTLERREQLETLLSEAHSELARDETALRDARRRLSKKDEVLDWVQTSRSWRIAARLRHLGQLARQLLPSARQFCQRLNLPVKPVFCGSLEAPAEMERVSGELRVEGWVFSLRAPVSRVEAFLDEFYLGTMRYGVERQDVAAAHSPQAQAECGYSECLPLGAIGSGRRRLTIRAFDEQGHEQCYTHSIIID